MEKRNLFEPGDAPVEYAGRPIVARLLIEQDDIAYMSGSKTSVSLKKSSFNDYRRGCYVDIIFLDEVHSTSPWKVEMHRYKMVSESEECINLRVIEIK